jgi:starch-binding outer membrane protein, SusD/RagB family
MKRLLIINIFFILILASCSKYLDVKPAGKLIPQAGDVSSFDKLLNNTNTIDWIYQNNNRGSVLNYLTDDIELSNNQADYAWYNGHPNIDCYYAYIFKTPYANPAVQDYYWNWGFYRAAQYFNSCIDGVNNVRTPAVEKEANTTIAQATVARAWGYFYAALGYGPVYKPTGDNARKVLPYRVDSDIMAPMEDLSTMKQIFDKISFDIHSSLKNIPDQASFNTRFGKVQTYAFLAHYHLFTQKFDSVAYYANKALTLAASQSGGIDNLFYDMNKFSWADAKVATTPDQRNSSSINTTQGSDPITATYNREICLYRTVASAPGTSAYPSAEYLALFDAAKDLRRQYFFFDYLAYKTTVAGVVYDDGRHILNFQSKEARTSGYTYPEILLMRAEGYARTNNLAGALADLNYLRKFRFVTGTPPLTLSDQNSIIQEVINERRRELPVGSPKRFFDLKRLCLDTGKPWAKTAITHTVKGANYTANIDSEFFILPISNDVLRWNPQWGIPLVTTSWSNSK